MRNSIIEEVWDSYVSNRTIDAHGPWTSNFHIRHPMALIRKSLTYQEKASMIKIELAIHKAP